MLELPVEGVVNGELREVQQGVAALLFGGGKEEISDEALLPLGRGAHPVLDAIPLKKDQAVLDFVGWELRKNTVGLELQGGVGGVSLLVEGVDSGPSFPQVNGAIVVPVDPVSAVSIIEEAYLIRVPGIHVPELRAVGDLANAVKHCVVYQRLHEWSAGGPLELVEIDGRAVSEDGFLPHEEVLVGERQVL